jgi:hypothetical protein
MEKKIINGIEHIKFRVSSQLVTYELKGEVWATCEDDAIEKFQEGDTISPIDEYPMREEINLEVEYDIN